MAVVKISEYLKPNRIYHGDARVLLKRIEPETVALSLWSPPYFVGKDYEKELTFDDWKDLLNETIRLHHEILKPGGFLAINIADILCFRDESMPKIMAENVSRRKINLTTDIEQLRKEEKCITFSE